MDLMELLNSAGVLVLVFGGLLLITAFFRFITQPGASKKEAQTLKPAVEAGPTAAAPHADDIWGGELKLKDVNDTTAAIIMAIVSDESGIPLSQLRFHSIEYIGPAAQNKGEAV